MAKYFVFDAEKLRAAVIGEATADDEAVAIDSLPAGMIPLTGAYVLRRNSIGPRYIAPPVGDADEQVIIVNNT